jgi:hypothetical protein
LNSKESAFVSKEFSFESKDVKEIFGEQSSGVSLVGAFGDSSSREGAAGER